MAEELNEFITIVSGFGRCGTSLVQQMIKAGGGGPCPYNGPAHEEPRAFDLMAGQDDWLSEMYGRSVKIIDPQLCILPTGHKYRIIWLDRNRKEQGKSCVKFAKLMMGLPFDNPRQAAKILAASYKTDRPKAIEAISKVCDQILYLKFEDILERPLQESRRIKEFLALSGSVEQIASIVVPRSPNCFDGLLEASLIGT